MWSESWVVRVPFQIIVDWQLSSRMPASWPVLSRRGSVVWMETGSQLVYYDAANR